MIHGQIGEGAWLKHPEQMARMQFVYGSSDEELQALLEESLAPRSADFLLDLGVSLLTPDSRLLDIGCRDAWHLIPLVERAGCTGVGIDPVERNLDRARAAVSAAGLEQRIEIRDSVMEQTGEDDDSIDVVWCRDVLEVIPDLEAGMSEVARVLKPGGAALIYAIVATPRSTAQSSKLHSRTPVFASRAPTRFAPSSVNTRKSARAPFPRVCCASHGFGGATPRSSNASDATNTNCGKPRCSGSPTCSLERWNL
jgi:SAM-dependent methyltransferase